MYCPTYERSYGAKYAEPAQYASAADIAKLIRRDIKAAIAAGDLPGTAKNYSVRSRSYSGGQAIDIAAKGLDGMYQVCDGIVPGSEDGYGAHACGNVWCKAGGQYKDSPSAQYHPILTVEGRRVQDLLQAIHDSYNHDGSDSMVDYFDKRYWGCAEVSPYDNPGGR